jgi:hypothetical protein
MSNVSGECHCSLLKRSNDSLKTYDANNIMINLGLGFRLYLLCLASLNETNYECIQISMKHNYHYS